jgi:hypothetical protein
VNLHLEIKQKCSWFWLRNITGVSNKGCCTRCFKGGKDNRVYYGTYQKSEAVVDIEVIERPKDIAYYLCGLSRGMVWELNTHVAFVPEAGSFIEIDNDRIYLKITDARRINFWGYKPNPVGEFTDLQRRCRNWIFANYVLDGMPL